MTIRTRFAPSPTGLIHLGNARTALFSAFYAKQNQGYFVLRIEDTDAERSETKHVQSLQDDLHWLNISWQEGPGANGEYGPYWQSQRADIYEAHYEKLVKRNLTYPCFCSDEELALDRKIQMSRGQAPRYRGTCQNLLADEIEQRLAKGLQPTLRFRVPENQKISFDDLVKGPQSFNTNDIGDFIIRRADGSSPFLFSNSVDDAMMHITHVIRGEDHVANTPRQMLIMRALDLTPPQYAHMALINGDDGAPLSKRNGSASIQELREKGYLPLALINYLARLGQTLEQLHLLSFDELAAAFQFKKLSRSPARFDQQQLLYWQKTVVSQLDDAAFCQWIGEHIRKKVPETELALFVQAVRPNICFPEDANKWATVFYQTQLHFNEENLAILQKAGEQFFVEAEQAVDVHGNNFEKILLEIKQALNVSGKHLYHPLRIALTGETAGPELAQIAMILGPERMRERFSYAFKLVTKST